MLTPAPVRRFIMSLQKSALNGLTADHHVAFCFTFLYAFPFLFDYIVSWAPPWYPHTHTPLPLCQLSQSLAILLLQIGVFNSEVVLREFDEMRLVYGHRAPVCLWYAFLIQLFCLQGRPSMVSASRRVLPLLFVLEGVSHHSFLLDLNGACNTDRGFSGKTQTC